MMIRLATFYVLAVLIVVAIIGILIAIMIPTFSNALNKARVSADEANLRSYYADVISDHMLNDTDLPATTTTGATEVTIDGVKYTLQAGKYTIEADTDNDTIKIQYAIEKGPDAGTTVTIPGGEKN